MTTIHCFKLESFDPNPNGGPPMLVARFKTRQAATEAINPHTYESVIQETIVIYDSAKEYNPKLDKASSESGLAKLTDDERKALGL